MTRMRAPSDTERLLFEFVAKQCAGVFRVYVADLKNLSRRGMLAVYRARAVAIAIMSKLVPALSHRQIASLFGSTSKPKSGSSLVCQAIKRVGILVQHDAKFAAMAADAWRRCTVTA